MLHYWHEFTGLRFSHSAGRHAHDRNQAASFYNHHRTNFPLSFRTIFSHVTLAHVVQREEAFVAGDTS